MKKIFILLIALIAIIIFIFYKFNYSYKAQIEKYDFSIEDIVSEEGYSMDAKHLTNIVLLADGEKIGLIQVRNKGFLRWVDQSNSVVQNPSSSEFAVSNLSIMKNKGENVYSEIHTFVAGYMEKENIQKIGSPTDFYLNIDTYDMNGKTLLFAHAIVGKEHTSFGSEDVINFIKNEIGSK
ncbi:hypothetical protein ABES58_21230 [Paenibacillus lautus]|uniref:hypothetical protein n=1 Tax=Paenibacillus lautus TaxID=1401 RepID=UPI003D2A9026